MKKNVWVVPGIELIDIKRTDYHPNGGTVEDGIYESNNGLYKIPTHGPSVNGSGNVNVGVRDTLNVGTP